MNYEAGTPVEIYRCVRAGFGRHKAQYEKSIGVCTGQTRTVAGELEVQVFVDGVAAWFSEDQFQDPWSR